MSHPHAKANSHAPNKRVIPKTSVRFAIFNANKIEVYSTTNLNDAHVKLFEYNAKSPGHTIVERRTMDQQT